MAEPTRTVSPPPRARMDASRLLPKNQDADFQASMPDPTTRQAKPSLASPVPAASPLSFVPPSEPSPAKRRPNLTVDIDADLRARVRAVYLATHHREGEDTFQGMIWKVLVELCERRERDYNAGRRFDVGDAQLRRGRPIR
ncbi:hypothetical protein [Cryobacterium sp. M15]|uniref:hypothetical protein n=1 Tax=Cryobacterium sp. M15 TaxID=2048291 RepID=UPI003515B302